MNIKSSLRDFVRLALAALVIGLGVGYALANWTPPVPGTIPSGNNTDQPINVSNNTQVKGDGSNVAGLGVNGILSGWKVFATNKLGVGSVVTGSSLDSTTIDPTAVLDVDGQIRIRGGSVGDKKVLTSDANGLATWGVAGISSLQAGTGITITPPSNGVQTISVDATKAQLRVSTNCGTAGAMSKINQDGTNVPNTCTNFVTEVRTTNAPGAYSGLSGGAVAGLVDLKINVGNGLFIDAADNSLKVNVNTALGDGDGLTIDGSGKLKFEPCTINGQTWQYDTGTGKWGCATFPPAVAPSSQPGESVIYLRTRSIDPDPRACSTLSPSSSAWTEAPRGSGLNYTGNENVGGGVYNKMRACFRSDMSCQVIYVRATSGTPSCPTNWTDANGAGLPHTEYAPGGVQTNSVSPCYICN